MTADGLGALWAAWAVARDAARTDPTPDNMRAASDAFLVLESVRTSAGAAAVRAARKEVRMLLEDVGNGFRLSADRRGFRGERW